MDTDHEFSYRLVFIDGTWAKTNMTRTHGRARRGGRLVAKVPHGGLVYQERRDGNI
jgi:hypothetical protein